MRKDALHQTSPLIGFDSPQLYANNISFDDSIPPDFYTPHGFSAMINKHCQHPSIVKIRENISNDLVFDFNA